MGDANKDLQRKTRLDGFDGSDDDEDAAVEEDDKEEDAVVEDGKNEDALFEDAEDKEAQKCPTPSISDTWLNSQKRLISLLAVFFRQKKTN